MTDDVILDVRGRPIVAGAKVAFNLSGELALGEVESAAVTKTEKRTYSPYVQRWYLIKVKLVEHPFRKVGNTRLTTGHVAKVRNPAGIIVLDDYPT